VLLDADRGEDKGVVLVERYLKGAREGKSRKWKRFCTLDSDPTSVSDVQMTMRMTEPPPRTETKALRHFSMLDSASVAPSTPNFVGSTHQAPRTLQC
jgi:hypothetical protein